MPALSYPFSEADCQVAYDAWGCNCGPAALAFALQMPLENVRDAIPDFTERRYTSPTMMDAALRSLGASVVKLGAPKNRGHECMFADVPALVRIQWTGPWTADGKTQKWAARQTHWICCWRYGDDRWNVFDINGGIRKFFDWKREIVPLIVQSVPRADGGWWPANVWQVAQPPH